MNGPPVLHTLKNKSINWIRSSTTVGKRKYKLGSTNCSSPGDQRARLTLETKSEDILFVSSNRLQSRKTLALLILAWGLMKRVGLRWRGASQLHWRQWISLLFCCSLWCWLFRKCVFLNGKHLLNLYRKHSTVIHSGYRRNFDHAFQLKFLG